MGPFLNSLVYLYFFEIIKIIILTSLITLFKINMNYKKFFIIFLSLFLSLSNLSNCLKEEKYIFNVTKIESDECNEKEGKFRFWIRGDIFSKPTTLYLLYLNMESPSNAQALCFPFFASNEGFLCEINIVYDPLTEKNVILQKKVPSSLYYTFENWEEVVGNNNVIAENIDCKPIIRNTFIYSSFEKNGTTLTIKGEWFNNSLLPTIAIQTKVIINNSTKIKVTCTYNKDKKTEFNCNCNEGDTLNLIDQLITASDNNVYKLEKKSE